MSGIVTKNELLLMLLLLHFFCFFFHPLADGEKFPTLPRIMYTCRVPLQLNCCCMLRVPGMTSDDVCFDCCIGCDTVTAVVVAWSPAVHQPHIRTPRLLAQGESLRHGSCNCIVAVLLMYTRTDFVTAHTPRTHTEYMQKRTSIHIHTEEPPLAAQRDSSQRGCCCAVTQRGCCCAVTATSTEPGEPCVMQQHSSSRSRARKSTNVWVSIIWALRGSAK